MIAQIFIPTMYFVVSTRMPTNEANAEIEIEPAPFSHISLSGLFIILQASFKAILLTNPGNLSLAKRMS